MDALIKAIPKIEGEHTSDIRNLRIIDYDGMSGFGIIRCNNKLVNVLRSSFKNMSKFSLDIISAEVFGVSGTIRALKQKFLRYLKE